MPNLWRIVVSCMGIWLATMDGDMIKVEKLVYLVRLNLINHFIGFIPCQFACNSTFRNPVFRWESCKGSV